MGLKALYMFMNPKLDSTKHRAVIDTPGSGKMFIIGVNSVEEGAKIAEQLVQEGVELIELCGAFGYDGARKVAKNFYSLQSVITRFIRTMMIVKKPFGVIPAFTNVSSRRYYKRDFSF